MPLSPERLADLDSYYGQQNADPFMALAQSQGLTQSATLTPDRIAELDAYYGTKPQQQSAEIQKPGIGRTLLDQGMQGLTFGYGDEMSDAAGSLGAAAYIKAFRPDLAGDNNIESIYNEARGASKNRLNAELQQNPAMSIASNIAGSLATGAPKAVISTLRSGGLAARAIKGSAAGAASGALYGSGTADEGNRLQGAATGAEIGGGMGAALPAAGAAAGALGRAVLPTIEEGMRPVVALAQKYNIPVSLNQVASGNAIKTIQKVSKELPFSGDAAFKEKQMQAFNRALISTTGGNGNKFTPGLMDNLFAKVGKEFDDFGKGKTFNLNQEFADNSANIIMDAEQVASKDAVANLQNRIQKVFENANEAGDISGEKLGALRAETNRLARKAGKAGNSETQELLHDLENTIIDTMTAADDAAGKAFAKTKQRYKNLLVLEPLAAKAKGGNISPALLQNRVSKIYGREFVRGNAGEIGDLARVGNEIMPELGGSDTVPKAILGTGIGTAIVNPALAIANAGKAAAILGGNRLFQEGINRNQSLVNAALQKSRINSATPLKIRISPGELPEVNLPIISR